MFLTSTDKAYSSFYEILPRIRVLGQLHGSGTVNQFCGVFLVSESLGPEYNCTDSHMHAGLVLTFLSIICCLSSMHICILSASPQAAILSFAAEKETHISNTVNILEKAGTQGHERASHSNQVSDVNFR